MCQLSQIVYKTVKYQESQSCATFCAYKYSASTLHHPNVECQVPVTKIKTSKISAATLFPYIFVLVITKDTFPAQAASVW